MTNIDFEPKEIIPAEVCRLEILDADKSDTYGPQLYLKLKVVGGANDGHKFNDYCSLDEDTGRVKQGTKAWSIFEACLGRDFHKRPGVSLESLIGKRFVGQVTRTKTGSRNKVEFGTIGPIPPRGATAGGPDKAPNDGGDGDDVDFSGVPF